LRTLTLDEIRSSVGKELGVSDWFSITQSMIDQFAELTQDHQWIHVDPERARTDSPYGSTIAHGFFTLSLLSHLMHQAIEVQHGFKMTVNYGLNRVRFISGVPAGSRVRGRFAVHDATPSQVIWLASVELEGSEKPALVAEWIVRFY
jgi:acyl dehydratase